MKFYITTDKKNECEKRINRMFKKFSTQPQVTYTLVSRQEERDGETLVLDAYLVEIEDIQQSEWTLVATVHYNLGMVFMIDDNLFKDIPAHLGLNYIKCDYCGTTHKSRRESHILYNNVTGEWFQVGTACVDKMIDGGKYLSTITKNVEKLTVKLGGHYGGSWETWIPDYKYWSLAMTIKQAVCLVKKFRSEVSFLWKRAEYNEYGEKVVEGTSTMLKDYAKNQLKSIEVDEEYFNKVAAYVDTLNGGYDDWTNEPDLNQKIKDTFENGFVKVAELFTAFFAQKGYESTLEKVGFEKDLETYQIKKGERFSFNGKVVSVDEIEVPSYSYYCPTTIAYLYTLKDDATGLFFEKEVGSKSTMESFKQEDGNYKFSGKIKYIAYRNQRVVFGGRLSKAK